MQGFNDKSVDELKEIQAAASDAIQTAILREIEAAKSLAETLKAKCLELGLNVRDLIIDKKPLEIKYRDPDNEANTWTGRGQMPRWIKAKMGNMDNADSNQVLESFRV